MHKHSPAEDLFLPQGQQLKKHTRVRDAWFDFFKVKNKQRIKHSRMFEIAKKQSNQPVEQLWVLQARDSDELPAQLVPPPLGAGLLQSLVRVWVPLSHDLLQALHADQVPQFPFAVNKPCI